GKRHKYRRHTTNTEINPSNSNYFSSSSDKGFLSDGDESVGSNSYVGRDNFSLNEREEKELTNMEGGEYFLPSNSDKEIERLQMQHFLLRLSWQGNHSSPIVDDFVNGGIWITDLATEFKSSTFIGIDGDEARARIQIELPNAAYLHHDLLDELPFPDDTFDFVNQRFFTMTTEDKWKNFILPEIIRVTKPDGYIELMEMTTWKYMGPVTKHMAKAYNEYIQKRGVYHLDPSQLNQVLISTKQIKNINCEQKITPFCGGRASQLVCRNQFEKIEAHKSELCKFMEIKERKFDDMIKIMYEEVNKHKTFAKTYRIYGQKI
ncbi:11270_t:CDS:2, partial [Diversispora eburnea]